MISKSKKEIHKKESKEWWILYLNNKSLRAIAKQSNIHYSSVHRRLVKYYGKDYKQKAKCSIIRSFAGQPIREKAEKEIKEWINKNSEILVEIDSEQNNFYSEKWIENQTKRHYQYDNRDDYQRYFV